MAWTDPRTWTIGEIVTKAIMDTHVRDNLNETWHEMAYVEFTADVTTTATTEAGAATVVSSGAVTLAAVPTVIEFFCVKVESTTSGPVPIVFLTEDGTSLGTIGEVGVGGSGPMKAERRKTPTAASHTYIIKLYTGVAGTVACRAGVGGPATKLPGFIRIWQKGAA